MPFTDNFNRAALGTTDWSTALGTTWTIASSLYLKPVGTYQTSAMRVVGSFADDQYAEVQCEEVSAVGDATELYGPAVRMNTSGECYFVSFSRGGLTLYKYVSGVSTYLTEGTTATGAFDVFYVVRLTVTGTVLDASVSGTSILSYSDASITAGNPGVRALTGESVTLPRFDDFESTAVLAAAATTAAAAMYRARTSRS